MKNKTIRLTEAQLRAIIAEEMENLDEISMAQAKVIGPVKKFLQHMTGAKQALGELYQNTSDPVAIDHAHALLNAINRIVSSVNNMPELTQGGMR